MDKQTSVAFGKTVYLLGVDEKGTKHWLEEPSWDCGWYWGFGYIETYERNREPSEARHTCSHTHFDSMFLGGRKCARDNFVEFFKETPLSDDEIWKLVDYMMTYYTLRKTSDLMTNGCSWQTEKARIKELQDEGFVNKINKELLPLVFKNICDLLSPNETKKEAMLLNKSC